ncbi:hypothetical protein [Streptomyces sp. NPDC056670]|uniref:hypothetical protein n=1 Tax=Streptomyces sp. NPDC056670 TaxID=3345904 RepID=UPI0036D185FC
MQPPHISVGTWWIIAAITTAMFLAVCIPLMPTRKYKTRIACAPLLGLMYLMAAAVLRGHDLAASISMYSAVMFSIPFGIIGRGKELKEAVEQEEKRVGGEAAPVSFKLVTQLLVAVCGGLLLWLWIR